MAIPSSSQGSLSRNDTIPTRLRAVNASVQRCDAIDLKDK